MRRLFALVALALTGLAIGTEHPARPVILVPGGGSPLFTSLEGLKGFFLEDGYPLGWLHEMRYDHRADLETIRGEMTDQLARVFSSHDPDTRFDVVAHSLGQAVVLYTLLESGLSDRIATVVGLAGTAHGQDRKPPFCPLGDCGKAIEQLIPYRNPFITSFYDRHREALAALAKCSLYSPDDRMVASPPDSGVFADGVAIALGGVGHLEFVRSRAIYRIFRDRCLTVSPSRPENGVVASPCAKQ